MEIYFERTKETKTIEIKSPTQLKQILSELNIQINSVILIKNDEICLEEEIVTNTDKIKLLSVVSGG